MKRTSDLENEMSEKIQLDHFLKDNEDQFITYDFSALLEPYLKEKHLSKAELARRAKMSDVYLFQILSGRRQPSRDKLLCLCIGLKLDVEQTQEFLKRCHQVPLYVKDRRDAVLRYGIELGWGVGKINDALFDAGEKMLG